MASTLENTRKWLTETATAGATSAGNVATQTELYSIQTCLPHCNAHEIVGVNMTGPGQPTLRVRYADPTDGNEVGEEALSHLRLAAYSGNAHRRNTQRWSNSGT